MASNHASDLVLLIGTGGRVRPTPGGGGPDHLPFGALLHIPPRELPKTKPLLSQNVHTRALKWEGGFTTLENSEGTLWNPLGLSHWWFFCSLWEFPVDPWGRQAKAW